VAPCLSVCDCDVGREAWHGVKKARTVQRDIKRTENGVSVIHALKLVPTSQRTQPMFITRTNRLTPREDNILGESHQIHRVGKMHKYLSAAKGGYARGTQIF
jgi:hypothetical protein